MVLELPDQAIRRLRPATGPARTPSGRSDGSRARWPGAAGLAIPPALAKERVGRLTGQIMGVPARCASWLRTGNVLRAVTGHPAQHLGPEIAVRPELAEHADAGRRGTVDQDVRRRQIELPADIGPAQVGDPGRLAAHPLPAERERLLPGRICQRREVTPQRVQVDADTRTQKSMLAQLGLDERDVSVGVDQPEQLSEKWREAIGKPVHGSEVENAEPAGI